MTTTTAKEFNMVSSLSTVDDPNTAINDPNVKSKLSMTFDNVNDKFSIREMHKVVQFQSDEQDTTSVNIQTDDIEINEYSVKNFVSGVQGHMLGQLPSDYDDVFASYHNQTQTIVKTVISGDPNDASDTGKIGEVVSNYETKVTEQAIKTVANMQTASDTVNSNMDSIVENLKQVETKELEGRENFEDMTDAIQHVTGYPPPQLLTIDHVSTIQVDQTDNPLSEYTNVEALTVAEFLSGDTYDGSVQTETVSGKVNLTVDRTVSSLSVNSRTDSSQVYYFNNNSKQVNSQVWHVVNNVTVKTDNIGAAVPTAPLEQLQLVHYDCGITFIDDNTNTAYKLAIIPALYYTVLQHYKTTQVGDWTMDNHPVQSTYSGEAVIEYIAILYEATGNPKDNAVPLFINGLDVSGTVLSQSYAVVNDETAANKVAVLSDTHVSNGTNKIFGCLHKISYKSSTNESISTQFSSTYKTPVVYLSRMRDATVWETGSRLDDGLDDVTESLTTKQTEFLDKLYQTIPPLYAGFIHGFTDPVYDTVRDNNNDTTYTIKRNSLDDTLDNHITLISSDAYIASKGVDEVTRNALLTSINDDTATFIATNFVIQTDTAQNGGNAELLVDNLGNIYPGDASQYEHEAIRSVTYSNVSNDPTNMFASLVDIINRLVPYGADTSALQAKITPYTQ